MTIERARRFARAYLDEFGPKGQFEMSMPSELELEMVAAVFVKELECTVEYNTNRDGITVQMPWFKYAIPAATIVGSETSDIASGYLS